MPSKLNFCMQLWMKLKSNQTCILSLSKENCQVYCPKDMKNYWSKHWIIFSFSFHDHGYVFNFFSQDDFAEFTPPASKKIKTSSSKSDGKVKDQNIKNKTKEGRGERKSLNRFVYHNPSFYLAYTATYFIF